MYVAQDRVLQRDIFNTVNEHLDTVKDGKCFDWLSNYQHIKKGIRYGEVLPVVHTAVVCRPVTLHCELTMKKGQVQALYVMTCER